MDQKKYKNRAPSNSYIGVYKVSDGLSREKIIHIPGNNRLFKLTDFIFHIYDVSPGKNEFGFDMLVEGENAYCGNTVFELKADNTLLPQGTGNMRNARIDSSFFACGLVLKLEGSNSKKYVIEHLRSGLPVKGRKYPYIDSANHSTGNEPQPTTLPSPLLI